MIDFLLGDLKWCGKSGNVALKVMGFFSVTIIKDVPAHRAVEVVSNIHLLMTNKSVPGEINCLWFSGYRSKQVWVNDDHKRTRFMNVDNGAYIVRDTVIGWLVYESKDVYMTSCSDYKSFPRLSEAKIYGESLC